MSLDELYARLPRLDCKGLCSDSCGPIGMSPEEWRRVTKAGEHLTVTVQFGEMPDGTVMILPQAIDCPFLSPIGRCSVYEARPMVCRLWGVVESMPCPHGCVPEGGRLPDEQGFELLGEAMIAGGANREIFDGWKRGIRDPEAMAMARGMIAEGMANEKKRRRRGR